MAVVEQKPEKTRILPEFLREILLVYDNTPSVGLATGRKHFNEFRIVVSFHFQLRQMRYI